MPHRTSSPSALLTSPVRASLIVTLAAGVSRILGFARDILIAFVFGSGPIAEALLLALRIPSFLRRLLGEGGVNAAFVPLYLAIKERSGTADSSSDAASRFAAAALINAALFLLALWAISHAAAPALIAALAGGVPGDSQIVIRATEFSRAAMPVVVGSGLAALMSARLNAEGRFALAAFSGLVVNLLMIFVLITLVWRGERIEHAAYLFALTWSVAGALHVLLLSAGELRIRATRAREDAMRAHKDAQRRSLAHPWRYQLWSPDQRQLARIMGPGMLVAAAPLAMLLAATPGAAILPSGIAWLYYADRLAQLPLGFVGAAASIVLLPHIARQAMTETGSSTTGRLIDEAMAMALALVLPACVALIVLARPIVSVLFERGAFTAHDVEGVAALLIGLAIGAPFAAVARVLSQDFLARLQWFAPVSSAVVGFVVTGVASIAGAKIAGALGLGLGITLGALVHAALLAGILIERRRWQPGSWLLIRLARVSLACLIMGAALVWTVSALQPWLAADASSTRKIMALAVLCIGGLGVYAAVGGLFLMLLQRHKTEQAE